MVFGKTYKERPRSDWHEWHWIFALAPHRLMDGRWVWLQWCEERMTHGGYPEWEYRLATERAERMQKEG